MMSEDGSSLSRRSSSQTSRNSNESKKTKVIHNQPRRSLSKSSNTPSPHKKDPSLTSFPSFSPEQAGIQQDATTQLAQPMPIRTTSQKVRDRKATLAGL